MDNLVAEFNKIEKKVNYAEHKANLQVLFISILSFFVQIAADYAHQNNDTFAVVIQPFVSNAKSDKFPTNFLSDVSPISM